MIPSEWRRESLWAEANWEELGPEKAGSTPLAHSWVPESSPESRPLHPASSVGLASEGDYPCPQPSGG